MGVDKETTEEGMEILKDLKEGVVIWIHFYLIKKQII